MSNINLSQSSESPSLKVPRGFVDKSIGISIVLLILSFGAYLGLVFYVKTLDSELTSVNDSIEMEKKKIAGDQANRVIDFQDRLDVVEKAIRTSESPDDNLAKIEASMLPETYLNRYEYDREKRSIETTVVAQSFKNVAEQIVAFKSLFSNVVVGDINRNEDQKLEVDMVLTF